MLKQLAFLSLIFVVSFGAKAKEYKLSNETGTVSFSGMHAGNDFKGVFKSWSGGGSFDPEDLENSTINIVFDLETAETGNKMYDGTLPKSDWFNVAEHPIGLFETTSISQNEEGTYKVEGDLKLRGKTLPISFDLTLTDLDQPEVKIAGEFTIDRLSYDIGRKSDAEAEWVDKEIVITLDLNAIAVQ